MPSSLNPPNFLTKRMRSLLYKCSVMHRRESPHPYGFRSSLFMFLLDLDELDILPQKIPLFSRNRFNAYSLHDRDHLYQGFSDIRQNILAYLKSNDIAEPPGRITLLTHLRVFGHIFNPVSFYFIEDDVGEPLAVIAEVHNTYGELKPFLLTRADLDGGWFRASRKKHFYISPFSKLDHQLDLKLRFPGDGLQLFVSDRRDDGETFFRAALTGQQVPLTNAQLIRFSLRFPFITLKVVALIHWHAFRIWRRGNPAYPKHAHPELQNGILQKASNSSKAHV